jgi:RNA polymerase sigma-70 factor (ECF subfamily)
MDNKSFSILVQQLGRKLYAKAYRILRDQEESEDVVQDVFIKLWKMGEKLNDYKSIDALAVTITRNCCIDLLRKNKTEYLEDTDLQRYANSTLPSPLDNMVINESDSIIRSIIEKLPDNARSLIQLHDIDGRSYEEIAMETGDNINTLRVNISRARKFIRDEYKKYHNEQIGNQ